MSALSIDKFISNITKGLSSPNKYKCTFNSPNGPDESIDILCNVAALPGRSIRTVENRHFQNPFLNPYVNTFPEVAFSFINTEDLAERTFFEKWQNKVIDPITGVINFRNEYTGSINISMLSPKDGSTTYTAIIHEAFPLNIGEINLGYSLQNETTLSTVTFTYKWWASSGSY